MMSMISTAIVALLVVGMAAFAVRTLVKDKREGKSCCSGSCGCDCAACHGASLDELEALMLKKKS